MHFEISHWTLRMKAFRHLDVVEMEGKERKDKTWISESVLCTLCITIEFYSYIFIHSQSSNHRLPRTFLIHLYIQVLPHFVTMPISAVLATEIAEFLGYCPMIHHPLLPPYVDSKIIRERTPTGFQYVAVQRSPRLVAAALIVIQSDFSQVQR